LPPNSTGGAETYADVHTRALAPRGHQVRVLAREADASIVGLPVRRFHDRERDRLSDEVTQEQIDDRTGVHPEPARRTVSTLALEGRANAPGLKTRARP